MIDVIIREDIARIKKSVKGDVFAGNEVLVTGGAGFIGSWFCDVLVGFEAEVTCLDDFQLGD